MYPEGPLPYLKQPDNGLYPDRPLPSTHTKMQMICSNFNIILPHTASYPTISCFSFSECIFVLFSYSRMKLLADILRYPFSLSAACSNIYKITCVGVLNDIICNQNNGFKARYNRIYCSYKFPESNNFTF